MGVFADPGAPLAVTKHVGSFTGLGATVAGLPMYVPGKTILFPGYRVATTRPDEGTVRCNKVSSSSVQLLRLRGGPQVDFIFYLARLCGSPNANFYVEDFILSGIGDSAPLVNVFPKTESFVMSGGGSFGGSGTDQNELVRLELSGAGANYDTITQIGGLANFTSFAQVIRWPGAASQQLPRIGVKDWSQAFAPALTPPVLVSSFRHRSQGVGSSYDNEMARRFDAVPGALLDAVSTADSGGVGDVTSYVTELNDLTRILHFAQNIAGTIANIALAPTVDLARSVALHECEDTAPFLQSEQGADDDFGRFANSLDLTANNNLRLQRNSNFSGTGKSSVAVIEFAEMPPVTAVAPLANF